MQGDNQELVNITPLVDVTKTEYLAQAKASLGEDADLNALKNSFETGHCTILESDANRSWLSQNKLFTSQIGSGLVAVGAGIGTVFGCVPCLAIAVSAGTTATGLGVADAQLNQNRTNLVRGLSEVNLADREQMLESLRTSRMGWGFLGFDIALAPLGLKTGGMIKAGKNIQRARSILGDTGSQLDQSFFKTMVNGLPEDDYLRIVEEIGNLPLQQQNEIISQLAGLSTKSDIERLAFIRDILERGGISFPSAKNLRNARFERVISDPTLMKQLQKEYDDVYSEFGITAGSADEQVFLTVVGIVKGEGCSGFCLKTKLSKSEVLNRLRRNLSACQ